MVIDDEPGASLTSHVGPNPLEKNTQTETRRRQELEMHGCPSKPRPEPADMHLAGLQHRKALAHHGHAAFVEVAEWGRRGIAGHAVANQLPGIAPLLHRHLRDAWQR